MQTSVADEAIEVISAGMMPLSILEAGNLVSAILPRGENVFTRFIWVSFSAPGKGFHCALLIHSSPSPLPL